MECIVFKATHKILRWAPSPLQLFSTFGGMGVAATSN